MATKQEQTIAKWQPTSGPKGFLVKERAMVGDITRSVGADPRAFELSALLLIQDTPSLQECLRTSDGEASLRNALMKAASTGLSLNPAEGKATIIAYGGKARYQVMKNGMIESAMNSGSVAYLTADLVRDKDAFRISKSINGDEYSHSPAIRDRGVVIGYYAAAKLKDGASHVRYMTTEEIIEHAGKYRSNKGDSSPWVNSFDGMALKTIIKSLLRNLHLSPTTRALLTHDDEDEVGGWGDEAAGNVTPGTSPEDLATHLAAGKVTIETDKTSPSDLDAGRKAGDHI
jgi:phage RecT family recombinase